MSQVLASLGKTKHLLNQCRECDFISRVSLIPRLTGATLKKHFSPQKRMYIGITENVFIIEITDCTF